MELESVLPSWCALKPAHALCCLSIVACYLLFSYMPVSNSVTWHDVSASKVLASNDLLPLSAGIRHLETGTIGLSLITYLYELGGPQCLSITFSLLQTVTLLLFALAVYRVSGSLLFAAIVPVVITAAAFFEISGLSRGTFGMLFLSLLTLLLADWRDDSHGIVKWSEVSVWRWAMMAVLFIVWTNFHASFCVGLIVLLCFAAAQIVKLPNSFFREREFQSRVWLFELALLITLISPHGIKLWSAMLWFPDHPIVNQLGGWGATSMAGWNGFAIAAMWLVWVFASRFSERIPAFTTLVAVAMTVLTAACSSCMAWLVPIMLIAIADLFPVQTKRTVPENTITRRPLQFAFTLLAVLTLWIGFSFSPVGSIVFGDSSRTQQQILGDTLPVAATTILRETRTTVCYGAQLIGAVGCNLKPIGTCLQMHQCTGCPKKLSMITTASSTPA